MPTNRRRRVHRRRNDLEALTYWQARHLTFGHPILVDFGCLTLAELVAAWAIHGDLILPPWIERFPGYRPFGWWAAVGVPQFGERQTIFTGKYAPAFVESSRREPMHFGILHSCCIPELQESELDYLKRHGLLLPGEGVRVSDGDHPYSRPDFWESHLQQIYGDGLNAADDPFRRDTPEPFELNGQHA